MYPLRIGLEWLNRSTARYRKRRLRPIFALSIAVIVVGGCGSEAAPGPVRVPNNVLLYEDGSAYQAQNADQPWSAFTQGQRLRFELRPGDHWSGDLSNGVASAERSELEGQSPLPFDVDTWLSFAFKVTASDIDANWMLVCQMRGTEDPGDISRSPVFAMELTSHTLRIATRSDPEYLTKTKPEVYYRYTDSTYDWSKWHNFVWRLRFSRDGKGLIQGWRDGQQIVPESSIPLGYNDKDGPTFKLGAYRATGSHQRVIVEDANVELGTSSLKSRVLSPLPVDQVVWPT